MIPSLAQARGSPGVSDPCLEITSPDIQTYHGSNDNHAEASGKCLSDTRALSSDTNGSASWKVTSKCSCRHQSWTSLTGSKKIAHIACIAGCGISTCPQSFRPVIEKEKEAPYPVFAAGKRFLIQRAALTDKCGTTSQPTIKETAISAVRRQADRLLSRAAHEQGNIPDQFWQNKSLRKSLRFLANANPMNYTQYTVPCEKGSVVHFAWKCSRKSMLMSR